MNEKQRRVELAIEIRTKLYKRVMYEREQGRQVTHIEMTIGAQKLLVDSFYAFTGKPDTAHGDEPIKEWEGYPVTTAELDVPFIVHSVYLHDQH